jgi:hypothetical protein
MKNEKISWYFDMQNEKISWYFDMQNDSSKSDKEKISSAGPSIQGTDHDDKDKKAIAQSSRRDVTECEDCPRKDGKIMQIQKEPANCISPAVVQIKVKVGQAGSISLSLCNNCVRKFSD